MDTIKRATRSNTNFLTSSNSGEEVTQGHTECASCYKQHDSKILECERCHLQHCSKCVKKTKAEYEVMLKLDCMWFCMRCRATVKKIVCQDFKIEERFKELTAAFEDRIAALEESMKTLNDDTRVRKIVQEESHHIREITKENVPKSKEVLTEINQRKARENNIIIFNIKECESDEPEVRKQEDKIFVDALCNIMDTDKEHVVTILRLGKRIEDEGEDGRIKTRPLKVVFMDLHTKAMFMGNLRNLAKETRADIKKISVTHDMTQDERKVRKEKVTEAKSRNEKNQSGDFKYVVRGPPWDNRIVKVKKVMI